RSFFLSSRRRHTRCYRYWSSDVCSSDLPERVELRIADLRAVDAAADPGAAQPVLLHALLELLGGEVGVLQRHRREGDEALGIRGARLGELLVLDLDDLAGEIAVRGVPVRVD